MSYRGKSKGFGHRFTPPRPSVPLECLAGLCGEYKRSETSLSLIREDVKKFRPYNVMPDDPILKEAIRQSALAFKLENPVKLLHLNDVFKKKDLAIWSSSPALPWTRYGYKTKADIRNDPNAIQQVRWFWHRVKEGKSVVNTDCCAFVRAQLAKTGSTKCRAVWGYPATIVFGEGVFAIPLIEEYSKIDSPFAYGYETGVGGCKKLAERLIGHHFLGIDYKGFDKTVPEWLIRVAFDILFINLNMLEYQGFGVTRFDGIYRMWEHIVNYYVETPIRLCNGERYLKRGGIASGSYFTQLVGSIANYVLIKYVSLKEENPIQSIKVLGDDSVCGFLRPILPSTVSAHVEQFGMEVNVEKSFSSTGSADLLFLGHKINGGIPTKSREKAIAGLVYPEHPDECWDDVASRALGILYANLGVDEVVDGICRTIVKFKPFELTISRAQTKLMRVLQIPEPKTTDPPDIIEFYHWLTGKRT